jgi:hypothetical protein
MLRLLVVITCGVLLATSVTAQTRCKSDGLGGYRCTGPNGTTTSVRPDGAGGYRATGPNGSVARIAPDGIGGFRTTTTPSGA